MVRIGPFAAALALLATSCTRFTPEPVSPVLQGEPATVMGVAIPDSAPLREPFTTYLEARSGGTVVGYVMRFDPLPPGHGASRTQPAGTWRVEDATFDPVGFVSQLGHGFRYRGTGVEELGQGEAEEMIAAVLRVPSVTLTPIG